MTKKISILFLASAALHAAVLGLVRFDSPTPIQAGSPFRVTIQASSPASDGEISEPGMEPVKPAVREGSVRKTIATVPDKQTIPRRAMKSEISRQPDKAHHQQETVAVALESIQQKETKNPSLPSNDPDASQTDKTLQLSPKTASLLRADLEQAFALHFQYPRLAIKRGWQGEVRLGLRIEANGHLSQVRILQGSGYGLLDKAALKSLNKVETLPEAIALLNGRSLDLILPVKYQLL
jgi:protein TonB